MKENRILAVIAAFAMAGTIIISGCSSSKTSVEGNTAEKSTVVTDAKTVKKAVVKADSIKQVTKGKTGNRKTGSAKAGKSLKVSVSRASKEGSKNTDAKNNSAKGVLKKSGKYAKSSAKEKIVVMDNDPDPDKNAEPMNGAADASDGSEAASASGCEYSDASENTETSVPSVPETPAEPPVVVPETPKEEPPATPTHEHTWEEIVELVHHDAVYGEPPLIAPAEDITYDVTEMHNICGICGANIDELGVEHGYMHAEKGEGFWYYNDYIVVGQRTEHFDAEYGEAPLITPAYDEWVGTGKYRCTGCGETK